MAIELNHTIVNARDKAESAAVLAELLGLDAPQEVGPFAVVKLSNGVSLDFMDHPDPPRQHYAFLVSEDEFDEIFGRIRAKELPYWADPYHRRPGAINTHDGGRGVYWRDPNGHNLEILTRA
jgi:catechol 2,3-dioxygenase-like lactoylglutathione lyase family enzyme